MLVKGSFLRSVWIVSQTFDETKEKIEVPYLLFTLGLWKFKLAGNLVLLGPGTHFQEKKISKMLISPLGLFMRFYSCWIFKLESWKDNLVIAHFMKVISPKEKDQKVFWLRPYAQNTNTCSMNVQSNSASVIWFTLYQIKGNEKKKVENIKKLKTIVKGRRNFT